MDTSFAIRRLDNTVKELILDVVYLQSLVRQM
jgi:hypothetical protein